MCSKCLTRGLVVLPVAALAVGIAALGTTAFGGSADVPAPTVGYAAPTGQVEPGLAPTTTSRDWQDTAVSAVRPKGGRF